MRHRFLVAGTDLCALCVFIMSCSPDTVDVGEPEIKMKLKVVADDAAADDDDDDDGDAEEAGS